MTSTIFHYYRWPALSPKATEALLQEAKAAELAVSAIDSEYCFNVEVKDATDIPAGYTDALMWLFTESDGRPSLEKINGEMALGFDDWDLDFYTDLFQKKLGRDPTNVEIYDMAQSNSEHSRHWFFGGRMVIDGEEMDTTLFKMVKATLKGVEENSVIAFHDNSSAIKGYQVPHFKPSAPGGPCALEIDQSVTLHPILTAETHNFPCAVAPFNGAETGTGGRLRDVQATGQGAHSVAGVSSYCVGNLLIPGYDLPWEAKDEPYPSHLASPLKICIDASDGASDYGNKYGEPVVHGFIRSFGMRLETETKERIEWVKPIMFSAGIGQMDSRHTKKGAPEDGHLVVKIGGPAYRIGMGGGAASSRVNDAATAALDFNAVQRGDAEMENRMNRVVRACIEMGAANPIISIHDQGCGGNGNVLKEIIEENGADYDIRNVLLGDPTMSVMEIWGAEYQENNALLLDESNREMFDAICARENCPYCVVGTVTSTGRVVVRDSSNGTTPVDLPLDMVLADLPPKVFKSDRPQHPCAPLVLPEGLTVPDALDRVLRLLSVGSKRFLVHKVDRSVTGLVAQQQCVGPLQIPLANCAVIAQSHFGTTGIASACGEQPIKGLLDPAAMARMVVAECLTNLVWAPLSARTDIKASGNWMWAAKLAGEGARMWDACVALRDGMLATGVGIDGGKDSLSMAAGVDGEVVKAPGMLTLTAYCTCPDVTLTVTPDLKRPGSSKMLFVDLSPGNQRMGGTSIAQCYNQLGESSPDVADFSTLVSAFDCVQVLIKQGLVLAGHDRSDGGLATTLLEMAFAGNCGFEADLSALAVGDNGTVPLLFNEELGLAMEVADENVDTVMAALAAASQTVVMLGATTVEKAVKMTVGNEVVLEASMTDLRDTWEATSFALEMMQRTPEDVVAERDGLASRTGPRYNLTYTPDSIEALAPMDDAAADGEGSFRPKVAVLRQEGTNGDREMAAAFHAAGCEAWDVTVSDLAAGKVRLSEFQGIVFCGGFSYADVMDSGKGWAGAIKFNPDLVAQFEEFRCRPDTFSLGICNGCQLMAVLGWIPQSTDNGVAAPLPVMEQPRLVHNSSGKFESRWSAVKVMEDSPAVLLKGMEGSSLGIWVAHGEGKFHFPDPALKDTVLEKGMAPLRYVDDEAEVTSAYPFCPNGSPDGIAAMCSADGRHLAMMPHPERCFLTWQWPYMPDDLKAQCTNGHSGPWIQLFTNARRFCEEAAAAVPPPVPKKQKN
mmetsp:Transcript_43391/g.117625  ORF Transcript_43391/g.117625 Transcript_43391/m.117625 type:complete len:1236 (-) Transcript_43391:1146-4853(-)